MTEQIDLLGIFGAGVLTFASPCILPLVPVYLGLLGQASLGGMGASRRPGRTVLAAAAFAMGLGLVFVALGMAATAGGRALAAHRAILLQLGGIAILLFGLKLAGVLRLPWLERDLRPVLERVRGGGVLGGFVLGAAFGLGWTPCIGPVLGSVLTFAATTASSPLRGGLYLATYASGLALPMIAAAAAAPLALRSIRRLQGFVRPMQIATGLLLATVGLLLLTDRLGRLVPKETAGEPAAASAAPGAACDTSLGPAHACSLPAAGAVLEAPQIVPSGPAMIEFVARSCPICHRMAKVVDAAERDCAGQSVKVRRIEVDGAQGRELARSQGVVGVPTFLFLDAQGNEVTRLVGEQPLVTLQRSLEKVSGEKCAQRVHLQGNAHDAKARSNLG